MTTAAAVAAYHQRSEEDQQGKSQENHQADGVVDTLVVFICSKAPELIEKIQDAVCLLSHGFRTSTCDSFY